jgi:Ran GTPase-activating protein (RanGAP) involved in mRNA processing and transport
LPSAELTQARLPAPAVLVPSRPFLADRDLEVLDLSRRSLVVLDIFIDGLCDALTSDAWPKLRELNVRQTNLDAYEVVSLAQALMEANAPSLRKLVISRNHVRDAGMQCLVSTLSERYGRLEVLEASRVSVGVDG